MRFFKFRRPFLKPLLDEDVEGEYFGGDVGTELTKLTRGGAKCGSRVGSFRTINDTVTSKLWWAILQ